MKPVTIKKNHLVWKLNKDTVTALLRWLDTVF